MVGLKKKCIRTQALIATPELVIIPFKYNHVMDFQRILYQLILNDKWGFTGKISRNISLQT